MKRIFYFFRAYIIDIVTAILGIVGVILAWNYSQTFAIQQIISLLVILLTSIIIIYLRSREREFVFSALTSRKDKESWIGHGVFQLARVQNAYEVTNADPGYIHSKLLAWSDYHILFDFKIANFGGDGGLGVIVRANNLANYIMLQFKQRGVGPHVRINSGWKVWQPEEVNLIFPERLSTDLWYKCEIFCDKNTITIKLIKDGNKIFDRVWEIPRGSIIFEYKHSSEYPTMHIPFPIVLEYGSIGFRNYDNEKAFIRNVLIEKL